MGRHRSFVAMGAIALLLTVSGGVLARSPQPATDFHAASGVLRTGFAAQAPRWNANSKPSPFLKEKLRRGYLPQDATGYDALKRSLAAETDAGGSAANDAAGPAPRVPSVGPSFNGLKDATSTPSDSTGAIGTTRYIENVNSKTRIYDRSGGIINSDTLTNFYQVAGISFDPQVIWDPGQNRFFYVGDTIVDASNHLLSFGYSKTSSPNNVVADWCHYFVNYGPLFPDYPKLGDAKNFYLFGVNVFNTSDVYQGSHAIWFPKPGTGSTCAAAPSGAFVLLKDSLGNPASTPVPAQQTDTAKKGWIVSYDYPGSGTSNKLILHKVIDNLNGTATIATNGTDVAVTAYAIPAPATQSGVTQDLDTSDARPTQAVSAKNPAHASAVSLWTQHTIKSGAFSVVRWYEINVAAASVWQGGTVTFTNGFAFNGAISPDRQVNGATRRFGSNMVLTYNTSSSTTFSKIMAVSKIGAGAVSAPALIKSSPAAMIDFFCTATNATCRWGDYPAATPDPIALSSATKGRVWITQQYNSTSTNTAQSNWRTWNAAIVP